jgi:hypothetical protein
VREMAFTHVRTAHWGLTASTLLTPNATFVPPTLHVLEATL